MDLRVCPLREERTDEALRTSISERLVATGAQMIELVLSDDHGESIGAIPSSVVRRVKPQRR